MKNIHILLALLCFLSACDLPSPNDGGSKSARAKPVALQTVKIRDQYAIDLPAYMAVTKGLNKDASLEYGSLFQKIFIIVIDESKDTLVTAMKKARLWDNSKSVEMQYAELQLRKFTGVGELKPVRINGLPAIITEADAANTVKGLHYYLGFVDGGRQLYTITSWVYKNDAAEKGPACRAMIKSFRLL